MADNAVELVGISKAFAGVPAVDRVDLSVATGEFLTLLGPSGCGKTTTLNLIAGFLSPDAGSIRLGGRAVDRLPSFRRDIGIVFQDYALFPHMTVAANINYGMRQRRIAQTEQDRRRADLLRLARLEGLGDRRPLSLSGGQQQRVALARALAIEPDALLLDEPLSALDPSTRERVRGELAALFAEVRIPTLLVTHDEADRAAFPGRALHLAQGHAAGAGPA
jgi:putative spermidine/putrescine transport system ATP-binding protein